MIYNQQPIDFIPDMEVVGCLIECNGKILLLHRQDGIKFESNKWGPPAGKINKQDNNEREAILREIKEETGLILENNNLNFHRTFYVSHLGFNFLYHYFNYPLNEITDITLSEREHKDFTWKTPDEALDMPLVLDEDYCMKNYYGIN